MITDNHLKKSNFFLRRRAGEVVLGEIVCENFALMQRWSLWSSSWQSWFSKRLTLQGIKFRPIFGCYNTRIKAILRKCRHVMWGRCQVNPTVLECKEENIFWKHFNCRFPPSLILGLPCYWCTWNQISKELNTARQGQNKPKFWGLIKFKNIWFKSIKFSIKSTTIKHKCWN